MIKELKEALEAKSVTEKELAIISANIESVPAEDLKRLGLGGGEEEVVVVKKKLKK